MSASHAPALDAIAFQLVAALERYDHNVETLLATWPGPDLNLYREVCEQIDSIRMYSSALPELRVAWVELLIGHAELVHTLWKAQRSGDEDVARVRAHHGHSVATLRHRCVRLLQGASARGA